jgi:hypothetical protein
MGHRRAGCPPQPDPRPRSTSDRPQRAGRRPRGGVPVEGSSSGLSLVPVSLGVAPIEVTLALVAQFVEALGAVVIDMDVGAAGEATFTFRIPGGRSTGTEPQR